MNDIYTRKHYVYRAFDKFGLLLYVGCSADVARRLAQHRANRLWTPYLAEITSSGPLPRDEALRLEAEAIASEEPFFNAQPEHTEMVQANRLEADRLLNSLPIDASDGATYYQARNAISVLIRHTHPVVDDDTRTQWYLAERARIEQMSEAIA